MSIVYYCLGPSTNEEGFLVFTKFWRERERERCSEQIFWQWYSGFCGDNVRMALVNMEDISLVKLFNIWM